MKLKLKFHVFEGFEMKEKDIRGYLLVHVKDESYDVVDGVKDGGAAQGIGL